MTKNILELMNNKEDEKLKQVLNAKLYNKYNSDKEYFKKEHYKNIINTSKIDIFISGNYDKNEIETIINNNKDIKKLSDRTPKNRL